jgi:hypothetical protein
MLTTFTTGILLDLAAFEKHEDSRQVQRCWNKVCVVSEYLDHRTPPFDRKERLVMGALDLASSLLDSGSRQHRSLTTQPAWV